jgi:hypothetical protein
VSTESQHGNGGGKAVHSGTDYQNRFAAWIAVRILAEQDAALPLDLPADVTLNSLRSETNQPIDDTLAETSAGGLLFFQAKHRIDLGKKSDSKVALVIDQFVRQFLIVRESAPTALPSGRSLDPRRDRFVLVTSSAGSSRVRRDLCAFLRRLRDLSPQRTGGSLESAASNRSERDAYRTIRDHLARSWLASSLRHPTDEEIGAVLELIYVLILDLDTDQVHELEARTILRASILVNPSQADAAWDTLIAAAASRSKTRSGADRPAIQQLLIDASYELRAARSYREDIECLRERSQAAIDQLEPRATIDVGIARVKINRRCTAALALAALEDSIIVVGEPGSGKSVALQESVKAIARLGHDIVYFSADALAVESLGQLRIELNLEHELVDVLANWPGRTCGCLVIDALDAGRSDGSAKALRDLIDATIRRKARWKVIAAIREFDLRYSPELQGLFRGAPVPGFNHPEFGSVRHIRVPRLEPDELDQIRTHAPALAEFFDKADVKLRELLRVAFNLRLMGELLGEGIPGEELAQIDTQLMLLDRYWHHRVIANDHLGDSREAVLRRVSERMVMGRTLRLNRSAVADDPAAGKPLGEVLKSGVLVEWQSPGRVRPDRDVLAYSHHVIHDYAIARLILRGDACELIERLGGASDLAMTIRPSLVMHFQHLWRLDADHRRFWELTKAVQLASEVPEIARIVGPAVAAGCFEAEMDCDALLEDLETRHEG